MSTAAVDTTGNTPPPPGAAASTASAASVAPPPAPAAEASAVENPEETASKREMGIGGWILFALAVVALFAIMTLLRRRRSRGRSRTSIVDHGTLTRWAATGFPALPGAEASSRAASVACTDQELEKRRGQIPAFSFLPLLLTARTAGSPSLHSSAGRGRRPRSREASGRQKLGGQHRRIPPGPTRCPYAGVDLIRLVRPESRRGTPSPQPSPPKRGRGGRRRTVARDSR